MPKIDNAPTPDVASGVQEVAVAPNFGGHNLDVISLFLNADIVVQAVVVLLIIMSIWSWKIIINKSLTFMFLEKRMQNFESKFWKQDLRDNYEMVSLKARNPMARIFRSVSFAIAEIKTNYISGGEQDAKNVSKDATKERIKRAVQLSYGQEMVQMQRSIGFLATVGSSAPFIGLFGTVWGIMNSFRAINFESVTLAAVAPGISEALFATAIGLVAAIPAVIFYNKFNNRLNVVADNVDMFTEHMLNHVHRSIDEA